MPVLNDEVAIPCPKCGNRILQVREGRIKVRTRLLIGAAAGSVLGICRTCSTEVPLPLVLALAESVRATRPPE